MKRFVGDTRGISVIVGAIMLTLIVVTAATSYAIFLDDQQKKIQASEALRLQRELESISVLSLENPIYHSNPGLVSVSFVLTNLHAQETTITSMNINNRLIRQFTIERLSGIEEWCINTGEYQIGCVYAAQANNSTLSYLFFDENNNFLYDKNELVLDDDYDGDNITALPTVGDFGGLLAYDNSTPPEPFIFQDFNGNNRYDTLTDPVFQLDPDGDLQLANPLENASGFRLFQKYKIQPKIRPREQIKLTIYDIENNTVGTIGKTITENEAITLHIFTSVTNIFSKTFYPPTSIIRVITESQWNSSSNDFKSVLILDGSLSDHPSEDAYILSWNWTINGISLTNNGRKVRAPDTLSSGMNHNITLTVTDNFGMRGISTITYP